MVLLVDFIGFYPGSFSPDSISQYSQAVSGKYNDWHPVWHTLLFFTIPYKLTNWSGSIVFFQIIYFSLFIGYFALTVYVYAGIFYAILSSTLILLSPFTLEIAMFPWKDTAFALASGFSIIFAVHIYFSKGEWCKKFWRMVLLSFMLTNATLFRHNGVLFTFFLLVALLFFMPKKKWILLFTTTLFLLLLIKVPLYKSLNVSKPGGRIQESTGFPLSVITAVAKEHPERLDAHTEKFIENLMQLQPDWKTFHNFGGFNSVKFRGIKTEVIETEGAVNIIKMMLRCFFVAPKTSLKATVGLTHCVYGLEVQCRAGYGITENNLGLTFKGLKIARFPIRAYIEIIVRTPLRYFFSYIGSTILAMLAFILFKSNFKSRTDWKRIFLCIPIFTYNFGTMLLLTGPDVRFFYVSFLVCPLVILILCRKPTEAEQ